jgi:hypothetical protein
MQTTISVPDFFSLFESVNRDLWPLQVLMLLIGAAMALAAVRKSHIADRVSAAGLGLIWIFNGIVFHWLYFRPIYEPAGMFAGLWVVQGLLFLAAGVFRPHLSFTASRNFYAAFGFLLIAYSLLAYPLLGYLLRADLVYATWFGPFPCPVGAFTIGMLLLTDSRVPRYLVVIPLLWALGGVVPVLWGVTEDIGLLAGGSIGVMLLIIRDHRNRGNSGTDERHSWCSGSPVSGDGPMTTLSWLVSAM